MTAVKLVSAGRGLAMSLDSPATVRPVVATVVEPLDLSFGDRSPSEGSELQLIRG